MPNLTGVEPYLYSLHSRFCFKGFVYTRPINHLLPTHNSEAFKVVRQSLGGGGGAFGRDNAPRRCPCKSPFSPPQEKGSEGTSARPVLSAFSIISTLRRPWPRSLSGRSAPTPPPPSFRYMCAAHLGTSPSRARATPTPPPRTAF